MFKYGLNCQMNVKWYYSSYIKSKPTQNRDLIITKKANK